MPREDNNSSYYGLYVLCSCWSCCLSASELHGENMRLVRICVSYLWPASLPNEPMVRSELEGWTQLGSGLFCTVFTSGSISEGEGVSLAPAMALIPARTSSSAPVRLCVCHHAPSSILFTRALFPSPCRITGCSHTSHTELCPRVPAALWSAGDARSPASRRSVKALCQPSGGRLCKRCHDLSLSPPHLSLR